mgnify:CR=1 FL=1
MGFMVSMERSRPDDAPEECDGPPLTSGRSSDDKRPFATVTARRHPLLGGPTSRNCKARAPPGRTAARRRRTESVSIRMSRAAPSATSGAAPGVSGTAAGGATAAPAGLSVGGAPGVTGLPGAAGVSAGGGGFGTKYACHTQTTMKQRKIARKTRFSMRPRVLTAAGNRSHSGDVSLEREMAAERDRCLAGRTDDSVTRVGSQARSRGAVRDPPPPAVRTPSMTDGTGRRRRQTGRARADRHESTRHQGAPRSSALRVRSLKFEV